MLPTTFITGLSILAVVGSTSPTAPSPDQDGKYTIESEGVRASFISYSAAVTNLWVADRNGTWRDIVLGYDNETQYIDDILHPNYGAIPGRYANRIANATYQLDGRTYHTEANSGSSTMHSGTHGWSYRNWTVSHVTEDQISFTILDHANSSMGMPGDVAGRVTYSLGPRSWNIRIEAQALTNRTPLMLTSHPYWNLDAFANPDNDTVLNHTMSMPFSQRLIHFDSESNADGSLPHIPPGDINDFWSSPKHIGANASAEGWVGDCSPGVGGYDCGWIVDRDCPWREKAVATISSDWSGIQVDMYSDQDAVVMTSCGFFPANTLPVKKTQGGGSNNGFVPPYGCVAVEGQDWIDGINHPEWGRESKQVFGPESGAYVNQIVYEFSLH